jgi:hypothetical protein
MKNGAKEIGQIIVLLSYREIVEPKKSPEPNSTPGRKVN